MANYMEEVANMLGVEMDQDFECNDVCYKYRITDGGLTSNGCYCAEILMMILNGELTIKRKPWKPKYSDIYYRVGSIGNISKEQWYGDILDTLYYKIGNCYKTREEAEANCEKWISFYKSDEVLEV